MFCLETDLVDFLEDRSDHGVEVTAVAAVGLEQRGKDVQEMLALRMLVPSLTHDLYYSWVNLVYNMQTRSLAIFESEEMVLVQKRVWIVLQILIRIMQQEQRQEYLYRELFESSIICFNCHKTEEILRCDILMDQTQCQKHACVVCFKKMKEKNCQCGRKYEEHYFKEKIKRALKHNLIDKATNSFNKELKVRKSPLLDTLDYDFANLLAYLHMNPTGSRISFIKVEDSLKRALSQRRKDERSLNNQKSTRKKAIYIGRTNAHVEELGLQSCGYDRSYSKGINLVLASFAPDTNEKKL